MVNLKLVKNGGPGSNRGRRRIRNSNKMPKDNIETMLLPISKKHYYAMVRVIALDSNTNEDKASMQVIFDEMVKRICPVAPNTKFLHISFAVYPIGVVSSTPRFIKPTIFNISIDTHRLFLKIDGILKKIEVIVKNYPEETVSDELVYVALGEAFRILASTSTSNYNYFLKPVL